MSDVEANVQDEFFDSLLGDFLDESDQLLVQLNANLLDLDEWAKTLDEGETARCDDDLMNEMFRAAHSIKGLSGMLGLDQINSMTHKIENIFDAARNEELTLNCDAVELVFQSVDRLGAMIEALKDPDADEVECEVVVAGIQRLLQNAGVEKQQTSQEDAERALAAAVEAADHAPEPFEEPPVSTAPNELEAPQVVDAIDHMEGVVDEQAVPAKYLSIFIDETELSLDSLTEKLLALESDGGGAADEGLLVVSHRIKGSAASVGLNRPAKLAHYMEDILQDLRESNAPLTAAMTDVMLKCTDALRTYVEGLKANDPQSGQFGSLIGELIEAKEKAHGSESLAATEAVSASSPPDDPTNQPGEANASKGLSDEQLRKIAESAPEGIAAFTGVVFFEPELALVGLKARLAYEKIAALGKVFYCDPPVETLDDLEHLEGLTFALSSECPEEQIRGQLRIAGVDRVQLDPISEDVISSVYEKTPSPQQTPAFSAEPQTPAKASPSMPKKATPAAAETQSKGRAADSTSRPAETLRVDIDRLDHLMNLAGQLVINKARFSQIGEKMRPLIGNKQTTHLLTNAITSLEKMVNENDQKQRGGQADMETMRSHARGILADLESVNRDVQRFVEARTSVNELYEAIHQLDRVTDGIQKSVMDTRMVPVGPLFTRFKRIIRDITRNSGKEMRLVIRGEKTELDKRMIDELGDPLIHMVRNSADHGIESPEDRERAGKPRQGTVTLDAFHRGNSIIIQVTDDGKGLDLEKIREKALERDVVSRADLDKMTHHQIYQLIWEPGFSTAEKVTEISGRGMGMDIVRSKIEAINGAVELDSTPGEGSVFSIKLPLTLAILPSLMTEIAGDVFAIPVESVVEIVSVQHDDISTVHGQQTATVRGRVVSVIQLHDLFTWHGSLPDADSSSDGDETTLVIIGTDGQELGLVVDNLLGEEDIVIKSMAENYRNVLGIAGASILGNGQISLILDIAALIEMASQLETSVPML